MNRPTSAFGKFALALVSAVLATNLATAQIEYYGEPTAGLTPGHLKSSGGRSRSVNAGVGVLGGEIMPFILQNDFLSSLPPVRYMQLPNNSAQVWLRVPAAAQVWFNDAQTSQSGAVRHYTSPPLSPGKKYTYKVRVRWMEGGKPVQEERNLDIHAGASVRGDFLPSQEGNRPSSEQP
jgi:uncharacterized protein (TIGR03000 family)